MKIYKMKITTKNEVFLLGSSDSVKTFWSITPKEGSEIVHSEKECKYYNKLYAIEYDTEKMSLEDLLKVMYKELLVEEVKIICEADKKLEYFFATYLAGVNIRQKISAAKSEAETARALAIIPFL